MEYRLRVSPWARKVWLRVGVRGLEVIVPRRYDRRRIATLLRQEQAWIHAALAEAEAMRRALPPRPGWRVPVQIELTALDARWTLAVRETAQRGVRVTVRGPEQLELAGQVGDTEACRRALRRWLGREAAERLVPRLAELSRRLGLPYRGAAVRMPRARWGSCSREQVISLNARLLLLPASLVDYVLVHELCHTRELNHSRTFWRLVALHCPGYLHLRADLRRAGKQLPAWALDPEDGA